MNNNTKSLRNALVIITNIPQINKGGIYCLTDQNGKRYIGSTNNLNKRVSSHHSHMKTCLITGNDGFLNNDIEKAVLNGAIFECSVLCTFEIELSKHEREEIERIYIKKYGGIEKTYNHIPIKHKV